MRTTVTPASTISATWREDCAAGKGPADIGKLAVTDFKGHTGDVYGGAGYALAFSWFLEFPTTFSLRPPGAAPVVALVSV